MHIKETPSCTFLWDAAIVCLWWRTANVDFDPNQLSVKLVVLGIENDAWMVNIYFEDLSNKSPLKNTTFWPTGDVMASPSTPDVPLGARFSYVHICFDTPYQPETEYQWKVSIPARPRFRRHVVARCNIWRRIKGSSTRSCSCPRHDVIISHPVILHLAEQNSSSACLFLMSSSHGICDVWLSHDRSATYFMHHWPVATPISQR